MADIAGYLDAAYLCKDHDSIDLLTGQLARGDIAIADGSWTSVCIRSMLCSLSSHTDSNANIVREMVASKIVSQSTDLRTWKYINFTAAVNALVMGNSNKEKEALHKITNYITENCTFKNWSGQQLSLLLTALLKSKGESIRITIIKVFNYIIKSDLSYFNLRSIASILSSLSRLQQVDLLNLIEEASYKIVLQHITSHLARTKIKLVGSDFSDIAVILQSLKHIDKYQWLPKIPVIFHNIATFISSAHINTSRLCTNDWIIIISALTGGSSTQREALENVVSHFCHKEVNLSKWDSYQLRRMMTILTVAGGQQIEKAVQKIADFMATANLNSWTIYDIEIITAKFSKHRTEITHKALQNITRHILSKPEEWFLAHYIDTVYHLSRNGGDDDRILLENIAKKISDDSFNLSLYSSKSIANLVHILSDYNNKYTEQALNKMAAFFMENKAEQLLSLPSGALSRTLSEFGKHYKLQKVGRLLINIAHFIVSGQINISDWPVGLLQVLLRILDSTNNDALIQQALRKIVDALDHDNAEPRNWSIHNLTGVIKGVSRLRHCSSEELITKLVKIYIEKRYDDEVISGVLILTAISQLPLKSKNIIKEGIKLATILYEKTYSIMSTENKLSLYWAITILHFVVLEDYGNTHRKTRKRIIKLAKIIPKIDPDLINKHIRSISSWQLEFINIIYFNGANNTDDTCFNRTNKAHSIMEKDVRAFIQSNTTNVTISSDRCIKGFPVDMYLSSQSRCAIVEVDGPHHFFKDDMDRNCRVAKDRFVDFVLEGKLGYKVMRTSQMILYDNKYRDTFIRELKCIFPY
ncbi:MAG: hypothetical protein QS721_10195 [Candidatus Endonucleobacter sp. (ex Gigantidas childressi)]|nr:hypothetical protein [Candidatus Endonucleobacter sp. (ex Gigantidas childressi)]